MKLIAVILTLNEEEHIGDCIQSLSWADGVLVFDSYSQDGTLDIAHKLKAETAQNKFENYAQQRNAALTYVEKAGFDWIFFVDADERSTPELEQEIRNKINSWPEMGWYVPRHNYIFGNLTLGAGWYPDYQARLFKIGKVRYERPVHEVALVNGDEGHLQNPLIHYNYKDIEQFHRVQEKYTHYEATIMQKEGIRPKFYTPFTQPVRQFWWRYKTLSGYKDGWHGLRMSTLMMYYEWKKYQFLKELS
ncbi:MAG: glycosyltransferase family 2 protein [Chloroflexota bacterium]